MYVNLFGSIFQRNLCRRKKTNVRIFRILILENLESPNVANNLFVSKTKLCSRGKENLIIEWVESHDRNFFLSIGMDFNIRLWTYHCTYSSRYILSNASQQPRDCKSYRVLSTCDLKGSVDFLTRSILIITLQGI